MSRKETAISAKVRVALSERGCVLFRNATTFAWVGKIVHRQGTEVYLRDAQGIHAGLCEGSADLIGWTHDGRFLAVEVKTKGVRVSPKQVIFIDAVNRCGGVAFVAYSAEDAVAKLSERMGDV